MKMNCIKFLLLFLCIIFLAYGCQKKPLPSGPVCPEDVPPCKCNPFGPGCKEEDPPFPNEFMDCPGKRCKQLQLEGEDRSRAERRIKKAKESLESMLKQIRTLAENQEVAIFVQCRGNICGKYRQLIMYIEDYFSNARNFSLQKNPALADVKVLLRSEDEALILEAVDIEGTIGNVDEVLAKIILGEELSQTEWITVEVPAFDEDGETAPATRYRIMRRLVSESEYRGTGTSRLPQTNIDYPTALRYCQKFGSDTVLPNLHTFEFALRQGKIVGNRRSLYEMIRITNEEDEVESQLINWEQDVFNFERFLDQMLIFSWISSKYDDAKQTYFQDDLGFRCATWEGFVE